MIKKTLSLLLAIAAMAFGQAQAVNQISGPPPNSWVSLLYYNGTNQLIFACYAPALIFPPTTYYKSTGTLVSVAVATNVGTITFGSTAQVWVGQQGTLAATGVTALDAAYKITAVSGSTATITTAGVSDGTYTATAMTLTTNGPVLNAPVWSVQVLQYASGNLSSVYWAGTASTGPSQGIACSNRANY